MKKIFYLLLLATPLVMGGCNVNTLSNNVSSVKVVTRCCTKMLIRSQCSEVATTNEAREAISQEIVPGWLWDSKMMF
jgi:hypothetical protein